MNALDNALNTTQKNDEHARIAEQGRRETENGMAKIRGTSTTAGTNYGTNSGGSAYGSGTHHVLENHITNPPTATGGNVGSGYDADQSNTTGYGQDTGYGGVQSRGEGMGLGSGTAGSHQPGSQNFDGYNAGGNINSRAGNSQIPQAPPELPARGQQHTTGSQQMYD